MILINENLRLYNKNEIKEAIKNNPNLADVPAIAFSNDLVIAKITPIKNTS